MTVFKGMNRVIVKLVNINNRYFYPFHKFGTCRDMNTESNLVNEGLAKCEAPKTVFYNPVQEYNRDLTIAIISEYAKSHFVNIQKQDQKESDKDVLLEDNLEPGKHYENGIRIFEGLAASGLRSIRFGLEIPGVKEIIANDFSETAVEYIDKNIKSNNLSHLVKSRCGDAAMGMYEHKAAKDRFHVIDLDPYGSPHTFLDSAVQAVADGGLLCITCTDAAVLCGNAPEKCNSNYGAVPLKASFQHEMALRIILQCLDSHANRYSRYIVPCLSLSIDFYFRVFVKVYTGQRYVKHSLVKKAMVYNCMGCGSHYIQPMAEAIPTKGEGNYKFLPGIAPPMNPKCDQCDHKFRMGGPIWSAPIHDKEFIQKVLNLVEASSEPFATKDRICGMLGLALEELPDVPLFYNLDSVCANLHCTLPKMTMIRSAFLNAGYRISMSHAKKNSYKTDAPVHFIWDIMKEWIKTNPVTKKRLNEDSVTKSILEKPQISKVCFDEHPDSEPKTRKDGLKRYPPNPSRFWGPKAKAPRVEDFEKVKEESKIADGKPEESKT